MKILAIETSCDETAIALLDINGPMERPDIKVLGNALMSQAHLHSDFGGVYPNLAKREHQKNLPILLEQVLEQAGAIPPAGADVDYISVTQGPGLEPALWNGITFAEELSAKWGKPIIPVDHLDGHVYSTLYGLKKGERLDLPALALIVSGGHTELAYIQNFGDYEIIGRTKDDAVGEAFDKVARMLGLPYPGGPKISSLAELSRKRNPIGREFPDADREQAMGFRFPRPMINSGDLNFSFSGLKTAVLYKLKTLEMTDEVKQEVARAFEDAAIDALIAKTHTALESKVSEVKT
ncbi:MAG: tRNA (adenosine(37)-N6)-threonylcarbamoyltransferase complex transferase subunit TsaD, partial [bacterium]|nr:tRNA (adenosine(37)-N6)-threonylcarbamoyltransferase complex transferase subunit TsaD [bacterium]